MAVHIDYETWSEADLSSVGAYRYAEDSTARILMFAIARDEEEPLVWDFMDQNSTESRKAVSMFREAIMAKELIYAHNAAFEVAITRYRAKADLGLTFIPSLDQWRCTAGMCRRAAIPHSLKQAGEVLKLDLRKDARGEDLMKVFSIPGRTILIAPDYEKVFDKSSKGRRAPNRYTDNPLFGWHEADADGELVQHTEILWDWSIKVGGTEMTVREAWEAYKDYCRQDVKTEMVLHKKLYKFELTGRELESFQFNLRLNDRGVPVNVTALKNADQLINQYAAREGIRFENITGLRPSQSQKFKAWMQSHGYPYDDLQAGTVEKAITEFDDLMSPKALKALQIYSMLNFAALKKVTAMLRAVCSDGKVRGTLFWHGARTGRATGKLIQPQNIKKATVVTDVAYDMLRVGSTLEDLEELWHSPLEAIASCARHFIELPGTKFYDADFVGVEARLTPWIAGEQTKLDKILAGIDLYKDLATRIFGVPYDEVTKKQRTIAKPAELGCCFGVAGKGLQDGLAKAPYYVKLSLKECQHIVSVYRKTHPKTVEAWAALETAAKAAIENGDTSAILDGRVKVGKVTTAGINYLVLRLPSGRRLYYPHARIKPTFKPYSKEEMQAEPWKAEKGGYWLDQIEFWGERPNNAGWGWVGTWGSRLFENIVQAMGADLLDEGCIAAEKAGFDVFLIVHDQALCYAHDELTIEDYEKSFCTVGDWAATFPLAAEGQIVPYYLKD